MIGNIINTVTTRISLAVLSIVLLLLNSNFLGSEGLGTIGIIVLEIAIYLLISNLICGGSLIYFAPRKKQTALFISAYVWIIVSAFAYYLIIRFVPYLQSDYSTDILLLGLLQSGIGTHINLMAGQQKIKQFNSITLLQTAIQVGAIVFFYFVLNIASIESFIKSTYIAYGLAFIVSFIRLVPQLEKKIKPPSFSLFKELLHYGFFIQIANITQLLNYRLSYFLLDYFTGRASVGRFIAGVQLSEGILLPGKSIGMVQYAKISNTKNDQKAAYLTVKMLKLTLLFSFPMLLVAMLIPADWYVFLLSDDFAQTPLIISLMGVGILALAGEIILSRYFSGTGQQKVNASSSTIGLIVTIVAGFSLIPSFGIVGAALTSSLSFLSIFIFLLNRIIVKSDLKLKDFIFGKDDYIFMKRLIRLIRAKS